MDLLAAVDWYTIIAALCFFQALVWAQHLDRGFPPWLNWLTVCVLASVFSREPGPVMALAAAPAFLFALWLWAHGLRRFLADDLAPAPRRYLEMLSATGPLVAAAAWIWSRYDRTFAGFPDPLATLTTVHFAITFGVLPLAMAASERPLARCRWRDLGLWLYVAGAPATALCFALRTDPLRPGAVEVAAAVVFAAGFLLWAAFMPVRRGPWPYVCLVPGFLLGVGYTAAHASAGTISPSRRWRRCMAHSTCSVRCCSRLKRRRSRTSPRRRLISLRPSRPAIARRRPSPTRIASWWVLGRRKPLRG